MFIGDVDKEPSEIISPEVIIESPDNRLALELGRSRVNRKF